MKTALGRGLGELIGEIDIAYKTGNNISSDSIEDIDVDLIVPNPNQPRTIFNEDKIKELSESIKEHGLLQPINVTRDGDKYILIAGERRLRATKLAKLPTIKSIILEVDDSKLAELAIIENIQRADLNILELANSYAKLINTYHLTHEELSKKISKSRSSITNTLRLLNLTQYVQDKLSSDTITLGHAKVMLGLDDDEQKKLVDTIIGQKLNVRDTESTIKNIKNKTTRAVKPTQDILDFKLLESFIKDLKSHNIDISIINNNNIKINFKHQNEISIISKLLNK